MRTLIRPRNERNRPELPLLSVAREKGVFVRSLTDLSENHNVIPEDLSNYKVAKAGSLVINKMKAWQGSMGIAPCEGIVSPAYYVYDLSFENPMYAQMLFRSKPYVAHFAQASDGVRVGQWDLSISGMKQIPVLIPPPEEQAAIVRYLNYTNGRIDRAIRAKRKTIALLNEQKQAIIHCAVTRGLDPSAPLKEAGVTWIGQIPSGWSSHKIRNLLSSFNERNRADLHLLSVVREKGIIVRDVLDLEANHNFIPEDLSNYKVVKKGQFVMNKMKAWQGSYGVSQFEGIVSPAYFVFNFRNVNPDFFHLAIRSKAYVPSFTQASDGVRVGQWDLSIQKMKEIVFYYPSNEEQEEIVEYVNEETKKFAVAISRLIKEIEFLTEYRTRLISDVVTGKLDVREAVKTLPIENMAEPIDDTGEVDEELEEAA